MPKYLYKRSDVLGYGRKHAGKTIGEVIDSDPAYVVRIHKDKSVQLSPDLLKQAVQKEQLKDRGYYIGLDR